MALSSLRLRRTLSTLRRSLAGTPPISPSSYSSSSSSSSGPLFPVQSPAPPSQKWSLLLHSRAFLSSSASLSSSRSANGGGNNQDDDIVPGTIMMGKDSENSDSFSILSRPHAAAPSIRLPSMSKQFLASAQWPPPPPPPLLLQSRRFRSSPVLLKSSSSSSTSFEPNHTWSYEEFKPRGLGIDAIEGCDFNHWLIVMDFPKDPKPSPEEMVRSYEETCAKALGISVEGAKKKIYACSTSNYTGFHVEVTEIESEKFNGQPGVVFVLPDSYVDPEKKEYGGDKYINGVIIPRPRPTLNGRRNRDQPKHDQQAGPTPSQQGSPSYSQEGPTQRGLKPNQQGHPSNSHRGLTPQSYPSKQSYGIPREGERRGPTNYPSQQNYGRPGLQEVYVPRENYGPPAPQNYSFEQNCSLLGQGERSDLMPMVASGHTNHYQQGSGGLNPIYPGSYNDRGSGNFYPQEQEGFPLAYQRNYAPPSQQGHFREDNRYYGPPQGTYYGQGMGGYQGQGPPEAYWQGANSGCVGRGTTFGYELGYPGYNHGQSFSQQAQWNVQGANFYPQKQREFVQGYQMNYEPYHAPNYAPHYPPQYAPHYPPHYAPPKYQGNFREDHQNYGPAQGTLYGQGAGGYQGQVAPEAYWQAATSRAVWQGATFGYGQSFPGQIQGYGFSQEQQRNMQGVHYYSQDHREFSHGGQVNFEPPRQQGGCGEYQNYGPVQGASYGQGVSEYQHHGNPNQLQSYDQKGRGNYSVQEERQWEQGDQRNYAPPRR